MPPETVLVTVHLHTDGPIPGPHSLLTLSSAAYAANGGLISTFTANVRELPGATLHPVSLQHWRTRAEDWLTTRRSTHPPALATDAFLRWIQKLPGEPTLVTDPVGPDYLFLYWYCIRFGGHWPFARTETEISMRRRFPPPFCTLSACRSSRVTQETA
jgi:hypothetical protein